MAIRKASFVMLDHSLTHRGVVDYRYACYSSERTPYSPSNCGSNKCSQETHDYSSSDDISSIIPTSFSAYSE